MMLMMLAGWVVLEAPLLMMLLVLAGWAALVIFIPTDAADARWLCGTGKPLCS